MAFTEEFAKFKKPDEIVADALCDELKRLLAECTEKQQEFFVRIYPDGIGQMPEATLRSAIGLCQRTIAKNHAGRSPSPPERQP